MFENFPQFVAFDPQAEVDISARNLPHWFQPGVAIFITMRTLDSMPWYFNGSRYEIDCAIVMPNHVHLIAMFYLPITCRDQCTSWQRFTAKEINIRIGQKGCFWQGEPFDHLIRSAEQFVYLRNYIAQNGVAAKLPPTDYVFRKA